MVLKPTYYLADIQTGQLYGEALPLQNVRLASSLDAPEFSAELDMRQYGGLGEGHRIRNLLLDGKCTLVPVLEGLSTGAGDPPTSRAMGEWWISKVADSPPSPILRIGGPEFAGYAKEALIARAWKGDSLDPVVTAREMLADLYSSNQNIVVDLQTWSSATGATVPVDVRPATVDYWSAIEDLQASEEGRFEWVIRTGLDLNGWSPVRVTRTLVVGHPVLALPYPGVTLELARPGEGPASLLGFAREFSEHRSASTIYGWGAGAGDDQFGGPSVYTSRNRVAGEPFKSRVVTDRNAMTVAQVRRRTRAALSRALPTEQVFTCLLPTDRYTPRTGDLYTWRTDAQWTRPAEAGSRRCVGWSWQSGQANDVYTLQMTEV